MAISFSWMHSNRYESIPRMKAILVLLKYKRINSMNQPQSISNRHFIVSICCSSCEKCRRMKDENEMLCRIGKATEKKNEKTAGLRWIIRWDLHERDPHRLHLTDWLGRNRMESKDKYHGKSIHMILQSCDHYPRRNRPAARRITIPSPMLSRVP